MSILLSNRNKSVFYVCALFCVFSLEQRPALCLSGDQDQQIEIEADTGELDDANNLTIYSGRVIVKQGSIRITGDRMTVYYTEDNDIDVLVMEGSPATFRQLPDNSDTYDEAQAVRMEYHKPKNIVILTGQARVSQESGSISARRIEYDSALSRVKITSTPAETETGTEKRERVKIIIPPKKDSPK